MIAKKEKIHIKRATIWFYGGVGVGAGRFKKKQLWNPYPILPEKSNEDMVTVTYRTLCTKSDLTHISQSVPIKIVYITHFPNLCYGKIEVLL